MENLRGTRLLKSVRRNTGDEPTIPLNRRHSAALPTLKGIRDAHWFLSQYIAETPLVRSEALSQMFRGDVWIKNETVSPIGSFKIRGALTELLRAREPVLAAVTSSTGNHGQGVAYAARLLKFPAHVFLPKQANPVKRAAIENLGAAIHLGGHDFDDAKAAGRQFANDNRYFFIDDGEGHGVVEGAGTVGLEIAEKLDGIDVVFIPVGSGTLAGGAAAAIRAIHPRTRVIGVEPNGSPAMAESFHAKRPIERPARTLAEGLICRVPADLALRCLLAFVAETLLVSDIELLAGVHALTAIAHILVEPSGAAAFAGAWRKRNDLVGRRIVLVLTGANLAVETLRLALKTPFPYAGPSFL